MRILLISLENTLVCFGLRMISSVLKRAGYSTTILFLPREFNNLETDEDLDHLYQWMKKQPADLIGISLMSSHMERVLRIQKVIRKASNAPVIWGGIHPSLQPSECLEHTDIVCVGEGEEAILELAHAIENSKDYSKIENLWIKSPTGIEKNESRLRCEDLDSLPFADHDDSDHFIYFEDKIQKLNADIWRRFVPGLMDTHYVMSTRGCPHNCSYCCNSALRNIAGGKYLRRRSPENFVSEMKEIKKKYVDLKGFVFMDDSFFYGDHKWFQTFKDLYQRDINLPFFCWANPIAIEEKKIQILVEAGLVGVHVGLESGSERISSEIFNRKVSKEQFLKAMEILHRYRKKIVDIRVDVITDNPYETDEDIAQTIEVLSYLKKPFWVGIVSLIFYPQTLLANRAVDDGIIDRHSHDLFQREFFYYKPTMLNRLMRSIPMTPGRLVRFFLKFRQKQWCRYLFYFYYFGYFIAVRRQFRLVARKLILTILKYFEKRIDPKKIVTTRVALIDF